MYGGIVQMLIEHEETFTEISTRLIGQVMFNTVSSVINNVLFPLNYCFKLLEPVCMQLPQDRDSLNDPLLEYGSILLQTDLFKNQLL